MTLLKLFEKVNLVTPVEQRRFLNYFEDSVNEIQSIFTGYDKDYVIIDGGSYSTPVSLDSDNPVRPLYYDAIVDNILFLAGEGEEYKSEFLRKAKYAFFKYWTDNAKGRRVRRMRW